MLIEKVNTAHLKRSLLDVVYKMLEYSYSNVRGGLIYSKEELVSRNNNEWVVCLKNNELVSILIYKHTEYGKKVVLIGCNGTYTGKLFLNRMLTNCLKEKGENFYCEASGRIESWLVDLGMKPYENKFASSVLNKNVKMLNDGYHYERKIKNVVVVKAIYGNLRKIPKIN